MYVNIYMYICMYIYLHIYVYVYICLHGDVDLSIHTTHIRYFQVISTTYAM